MINRDEWLAAVKDAEATPLPESGALTLQEVAAIIGLKRQAAELRVKLMLQAGTATKTTKQIRRTDGHIVTVTAYRLEPRHEK